MSSATAAAAPEQGATSSASSAPPSARPAKLRSCVVCRSRKVRCDKQSPCSNCRRANIACVVQPNDRPPKWARRLERITNGPAAAAEAPRDADPGVAPVMERLRNLEGLVKELSGQLEQAHAAAGSSAGGSPEVNSPGSSTNERDVSGASVQKHFGRMVLHDASRSRYVSSGFWSRVSDELDGLKMDTRGLAADDSDSSDDETSPAKTPSTQELERTPSERHAFLFRHNLTGSMPDLREFRPLPSEIPFLLSTFSENVNLFVQVVHIPTITKMIREKRGNMASLSPGNEALIFSIYYAAVTSMEEDDVMTNFGSTKAELNLKYRLGLEHALARADFLNAPDLVLIQAFTIFLLLVRRHDSPRFVWMMTGLVIRMAQAIGLQRDGSHFEHLTPFEVEMRRRVWWSLCLIDIRASEDQGMEFTITSGSFDTKIPLNINDADINPDTEETPAERNGISDMIFPVVICQMSEIVQQMMSPAVRNSATCLEEQSRLLNSLQEKVQHGYIEHSKGVDELLNWVGTTATRVMISKMRLLIYLPALFSSLNDNFSDDIRAKLLIAAIEVAEYNHALNADHACRQWRWIYQTYTHWHSIIYMLIDILRRPWSPIVERAWVALHSTWLIPAQESMDAQSRIWVPLRKLMAKARRHRKAELQRLGGDARALEQLEIQDRSMPVPSSSGPFGDGNSEQMFFEHWRSLFAGTESGGHHHSGTPATGTSQPSVVGTVNGSQQCIDSGPAYEQQSWPDPNFEMTYQAPSSQGGGPATTKPTSNPTPATSTQNQSFSPEQNYSSSDAPPTVPQDWSGGQSIGPGFVPWLWADADPTVDVFADVDVSMDLDSDVDWNSWIQSATGAEVSQAAASWPTPMPPG